MLPAIFLCLLLPAVAAAKVDLSGGLGVTYWAQQQRGDQGYQLATAAGWQHAGTQVTAAPFRGAVPATSRKTFLLANSLYGNLRWNIMPGIFIGGGYLLGDMANTNMLNGVPVGRSKFTAGDVYGVWDIVQQVLVSGEYATMNHDRMALESDAGVIGNPPRTQLAAVRVNEYVLKAVYHGIPDWECGIRYSVVDPQNFAAELLAGYSRESKLSLAVGYQFAGSAQLRAEYSRLITDYDYLNSYDPALLVGQYRLNPAEDPRR